MFFCNSHGQIVIEGSLAGLSIERDSQHSIPSKRVPLSSQNQFLGWFPRRENGTRTESKRIMEMTPSHRQSCVVQHLLYFRFNVRTCHRPGAYSKVGILICLFFIPAVLWLLDYCAQRFHVFMIYWPGFIHNETDPAENKRLAVIHCYVRFGEDYLNIILLYCQGQVRCAVIQVRC